jgi:hypothetical protein
MSDSAPEKKATAAFVRPVDVDVRTELARVRDLVSAGVVKIEVFNQLNETARSAARRKGMKKSSTTIQGKRRATAFVLGRATGMSRVRTTHSAGERDETPESEFDSVWRASLEQPRRTASSSGSNGPRVGRLFSSGGAKLSKFATNIAGGVAGARLMRDRVGSLSALTSPLRSSPSTHNAPDLDNTFHYKPLLESHLMMFVYDHTNGPVRKRWVRRVCVCYPNGLTTYRASPSWPRKKRERGDRPTGEELKSREAEHVTLTPLTHAVKGSFMGFFAKPSSVPPTPSASYLHPVGRRGSKPSRSRIEKKDLVSSMFSYENSYACSRSIESIAEDGNEYVTDGEGGSSVGGTERLQGGRSFVFSVFDDRTTYLFAASSAELRDFWVSVLKQVSQEIKAQAEMRDHPVLLGRDALDGPALERLASERLAAYRQGLASQSGSLRVSSGEAQEQQVESSDSL